MATYLATYDPKAVQILIDGVEVTGFPSGRMVTVTRNEEVFTNHIGTKGEVSRALNRNNTYTITLPLQQTSEFNRWLNIQMNAEQTLGIPPVMTFTVVDPASYENVFTAACWIQGEPERGWSNEVEAREWTLFATATAVTPS